MGKVLLSVILVGILAGCAGFANQSQFAPSPLRVPNSGQAPAPAAEEDRGFFDGLGDLGDIGGGGDGMFDGDEGGGAIF